MDMQVKPEMIISETGNKFKTLKVTGLKGMEMPAHFCTKEAVIVVLSGEAVLMLTEKVVQLKTSQSAIIPANDPHKLILKEDFHAVVVMEVDAEIKFVTQ